MREFPTKDVFFGFGKMGDAVESEGILCCECAFPKQILRVSQAMCPSELCSILHELLVGQASKRVRELGVGFGDGIVNVGLVGTFFIRVVNGANWTFLLTFLDIGTFGRHSGPGEKLQHVEGGASCPWLLYVRENIMYLTRELDWAGEVVELNRVSHILFRQPTASTSSVGGPSLSKMNDPQADLSFHRRRRLVHTVSIPRLQLNHVALPPALSYCTLNRRRLFFYFLLRFGVLMSSQ
jgi:hypothetical protein